MANLAKVVRIEHRGQLRLSDQDDLKQFFLIGFQVGQQPQLFEYGLAQVLGLVDYDDDFFAFMFFLKQKMIELIDQVLGVVAPVLDAEFIADASHELLRPQFRVEDVGGDGPFIQAFQKGPAQGGLAGTHLTGDFNKSVPLRDGIV